MFDKNSTAAGGAQDFAGTIQGIVAGHEKNELFTKLHGGEPYAAELNALIDCVNEELEYQRFRLRMVNEAVKSGMWYMKINPDFSIAYGIWSAGGVAVTAIASRFLFGEPLTRIMVAGIALIMAGVLFVELGSAH